MLLLARAVAALAGAQTVRAARRFGARAPVARGGGQGGTGDGVPLEPGRAALADRDDARLARRIPERKQRLELLRTVHYEATRARLDPQLVLGVMEVESGFRKYAVSRAGARGYMQVMPFWVKLIGQPEHNLFHLRTNLAYGCAILRFYLDMENGDYFRALGRYNGSLGQAEYPNLVLSAWRGRWRYDGPIG